MIKQVFGIWIDVNGYSISRVEYSRESNRYYFHLSMNETLVFESCEQIKTLIDDENVKPYETFIVTNSAYLSEFLKDKYRKTLVIDDLNILEQIVKFQSLNSTDEFMIKKGLSVVETIEKLTFENVHNKTIPGSVASLLIILSDLDAKNRFKSVPTSMIELYTQECEKGLHDETDLLDLINRCGGVYRVM
jgi:hypothetical protein